MHLQAYLLVEGTIRRWEAQGIIRRAGHSLESLSPTLITSPAAVRGPTILPAVPTSQLTSSILEGALEISPSVVGPSVEAVDLSVAPSIPVDSPAGSVGSLVTAGDPPVGSSVPVDYVPASPLPWPSSPIAQCLPMRHRSASADPTISLLGSPRPLPPPQASPHRRLARLRGAGPVTVRDCVRARANSADGVIVITDGDGSGDQPASPTPASSTSAGPLGGVDLPVASSVPDVASATSVGLPVTADLPVTSARPAASPNSVASSVLSSPPASPSPSPSSPVEQHSPLRPGSTSGDLTILPLASPRPLPPPQTPPRRARPNSADSVITITDGDGSDDQPETPTPDPIPGKRKRTNTSANAPLRKQPARIVSSKRKKRNTPAEQPVRLALRDPTPPVPIAPALAEYYPSFIPQLPKLDHSLIVDIVDIKLEDDSGQMSYSHLLYRTFTNGEKMFLALQVLANVSMTRDETNLVTDSNLTTEKFSFVTGPASRMLAASRHAQKQLEMSEIGSAQLRIETLMCYITLYLTLEHAVVPQLQRENKSWGSKQIAGKKYDYFYQLLGNKSDSVMGGGRSGAKSKFGANIGFGKTYWSLLQELGIAALLMLAVADTGLTVIARAMGAGNDNRRILVLSLCRSRAWWSFAHAIGPATLRMFFGPCDMQYTVQQLLQHLRAEPLTTASIILINQSCQTSGIALANEPARDNVTSLRWELVVGEAVIPIRHLPNSAPRTEPLRRNIWWWVSGCLQSRPAFEFLLPSGKGSIDSINFFCDFYNRRAIPGRKAARMDALLKLHERHIGQSTQQRLDILANEEQSKCDLLVFAAPVDDVVLGVILYPQTTTATIYDWTAQTHLAVKVAEVAISGKIFRSNLLTCAANKLNRLFNRTCLQKQYGKLKLLRSPRVQSPNPPCGQLRSST